MFLSTAPLGVDGALHASCRAARARAGSCRAPRGRRRRPPRRARTARTASMRLAARRGLGRHAGRIVPGRQGATVSWDVVLGYVTGFADQPDSSWRLLRTSSSCTSRRRALPPVRPQQRLPKNLWTARLRLRHVAVAVLLLLPKRAGRGREPCASAPCHRTGSPAHWLTGSRLPRSRTPAPAPPCGSATGASG